MKKTRRTLSKDNLTITTITKKAGDLSTHDLVIEKRIPDGGETALFPTSKTKEQLNRRVSQWFFENS